MFSRKEYSKNYSKKWRKEHTGSWSKWAHETGHIVNDHSTFIISNSQGPLLKWAEYERPLDRVITCCNKMKMEA
jgi:hypothetical protein